MSVRPALHERIVRCGLLVLGLFTPLAFGTVEAWAIALMEWGIFTLLLVFLLGRQWDRIPGGRPGTRLTGLEVPFVCFLVFCTLQTVPLPSPWLRILSPGSALLYQVADSPRPAELSIGSIPAGPLPAPDALDRRPVSIEPEETWSRIRMMAAFLGLFFLTVSWADRRERIVFLLAGVTVIGCFVATEGLLQFLTWNGKIFWVRKVPPSSAFGPFVNHNHFAGYVEMLIPVAISMTFYLSGLRSAGEDPPTPMPQARMFAQRLRRRPLGEGRWSQAGLALFGAVILTVSLILTLSRGGILSTVLSGLILFLLLGRRLVSRSSVWVVVMTLSVLVIGLILWIGAETVAHRLDGSHEPETEASFRSRVLVWKSVVEHLPAYLWVGSGLGTFEQSFAYATPPGSSARWDRAHNDYLQILWETGLGGSLLFFSGLGVFVRQYWWRGIRSRGHPLDILRVGIAVSLLSIALHSIVDFNLQIGANGFLCSMLAGLLVALDRSVREEAPDRPTGIRSGVPGA